MIIRDSQGKLSESNAIKSSWGVTTEILNFLGSIKDVSGHPTNT